MDHIDSRLIVAFGTLLGGLVAYLAGFALLHATRRPPPSDGRASEGTVGARPSGPPAQRTPSTDDPPPT